MIKTSCSFLTLTHDFRNNWLVDLRIENKYFFKTLKTQVYYDTSLNLKRGSLQTSFALSASYTITYCYTIFCSRLNLHRNSKQNQVKTNNTATKQKNYTLMQDIIGEEVKQMIIETKETWKDTINYKPTIFGMAKLQKLMKKVKFEDSLNDETYHYMWQTKKIHLTTINF